MTVPAISATGLAYAYPDGRRAVEDVSFTVEPGESVGLVGPNGAGKTTLFLLLAGLLEPSLQHCRLCTEFEFVSRVVPEQRIRHVVIRADLRAWVDLFEDWLQLLSPSNRQRWRHRISWSQSPALGSWCLSQRRRA